MDYCVFNLLTKIRSFWIKRRRHAYGLTFFVIILINNQTGNNIPHKYEGIKVNSLKNPVNVVSSSFKYKK